MNESMHDAEDEIKRLDHIIYVSLKYTRTVDVIRNALARMISAYDKMMDTLLEHAKMEGRIELIPRSSRMKNSEILELYGEDENTKIFMGFYSFLRNLMKAEYKRRDEYRRHVTMIADMINSTCEVDIDVLEDSFYPMATGFFEFTKKNVIGEVDD